MGYLVVTGKAEIDAAQLMLNRLGISPEQLHGPRADTNPAPSFRAYVAVVKASVAPSTVRAYSSYWTRIEAAWADRPITEPTSTEIKQLVQQTKKQAVTRRNSRGGRSAERHMIAALRCLYRHAEDDGHLSRANNPAQAVKKPRALPSTRCALHDDQMAEIFHISSTTGNDPDLDSLILRLHSETAARRGGALALELDDLDPSQCLIQLREKGETIRWQPVSPTLMNALLQHVEERGGNACKHVLRYRDGRPITKRRYDHIWQRLGRYLPWVKTMQVSTHWLRHTTLTWVERNFGYAVARAYAGHTDSAGNIGATLTYVRATIYEVAIALAALTSEPHPLVKATETVRSSNEAYPHFGTKA